MKNNKLLLILFFLSTNLLNAEVLLFSKAYELALENANEIKSSVYMSKSDKEKIKQERSQLYPQINLSAYYRKSEYQYNPTNAKTEQGLLNYSLTVKQSVYNPEIYSRISTQESRSEYSDSKVKLEKLELAQKVFSTYLDVLKSKNKIKLFQSYLEYNKLKLQELDKKYEMHLANKMDLLQMRVEYNSAGIDLTKEKKLFDLSELRLRQLIGDIEYELPTIEFDKPILNMISSMRETFSSDNESLKIKQAQIALKIYKSDIENAEDAHLPKVNLDASYAKYDTDDPTIDSQYNNVKYLMLSLNVPIYSGGYASSKVVSAKLRHQSGLEDLVIARKEVKVEYSEYLALFDASVASVSMYKKALESSELYVEAIEQGYEHGLKSIIDLNDAKNKFYEVKYKYIENIYEMVHSYIGLLIVTNNFKDIDLLDKLVE